MKRSLGSIFLANCIVFGIGTFCVADSHCKLGHSEELYEKSGKKSRWEQVEDADERAGDQDAFDEYARECSEDAEEEDAEFDPLLEVPPLPAPVLAEPVLDMPIPPPVLEPVLDMPPTASVLVKGKPLVHANSSSSVCSDATTLILGQTPKTPQPRGIVATQVPSTQLTPSPPSLPSQVLYKEVLYVADSPRKMVKAEPKEKNDDAEDGSKKQALLSELANLQAAQQALLSAGAKLASEPAPTELETTEAEATEPEAAEPETAEPVNREAAMRELSLLEAQLPLGIYTYSS